LLNSEVASACLLTFPMLRCCCLWYAGSTCRYAFIDEPLTGSSATICGGIGRSSDRERHVYTSRSHRVGVQLLHANNGASFLLKFEGTLYIAGMRVTIRYERGV